MCLCSEKEGLWGFFFICLRKERMFSIMFFSGSNIKILNMIHSAEMLRSQSYWVVYSMLTLTSLWHEHINWRHCAQRKKKQKHFSVLRYLMAESDRKRMKTRLVFPRLRSDTTSQTYSIFQEFLKRCWQHFSFHAQCSKRCFWEKIWWYPRWEVNNCLLNILLTKSHKII